MSVQVSLPILYILLREIIIMPKLNDVLAERMARKHRIPLPKQILAKNAKQAAAAAKKIGFPVVLKVSSPDIVHKTEVGGIALGLKSEEEVLDAFEKVMKAKKKPKAKIDGVLVQEHVNGHEVIVGGKVDDTFGPVVMFGLGGIFVEVLKDVSFRVVPIERKDAKAMIEEIRGYPVLKGARGKKPVNFKALEDCLLAVSRLMEKEKKVKELDINPLFINENKAVASDVRVLV
jgi:acyl-CoA synthetase (NDP forming)